MDIPTICNSEALDADDDVSPIRQNSEQSSSSRTADVIDNGNEFEEARKLLALSDDMGDDSSEDTSWESAMPTLKRVLKSSEAYLHIYKREGLRLQGQRTYFEVPIIVLSAVNSVFIAGGDSFLNPTIVKAMTIVVSLLIGIVQGLRTFMKVDERVDSCMSTHRALFKLYCDIEAKVTSKVKHRGIDADKFLSEANSTYSQIMEAAIVLPGGKSNPIFIGGDMI